MGIRLYEYLRRSSTNEIVRGKQDLNANVLKAVLTRYAPMQSALDFFGSVCQACNRYGSGGWQKRQAAVCVTSLAGKDAMFLDDTTKEERRLVIQRREQAAASLEPRRRPG